MTRIRPQHARTTFWWTSIGAILATLVLPTGAGAASITATINRTEVAVGDRLQLTLTLEGSSAGEIELPDLSAFEVHSQGQSRNIQLINGRMNSSVALNYLLIPTQPGTFTIGSVRTKVDGKAVMTKPITVRVLAAEETPKQTRDLFMIAKVSNESPYVGEQVVFSLRIYQRIRLAQASLEALDFGGALAEDLGKESTYDATVNGIAYQVTEIKKALFPQQAGELVLPAVRLNAEVVVQNQGGRRRGTDPFGDIFNSPFDDFFGRGRTETRTVTAPPVTLTVRPLPPAPANFSGMVGSFSIKANLTNATVKVGESTTLSLTVSGRGNPPLIKEPTLPALEGFKIYDDKPTLQSQVDGEGLTGVKVFGKALVPMRAGMLSIPAARLTFFEPATGEYVTRSTTPITLTVADAPASEDLRLTQLVTPTGGKVAVRLLADDLLPNYSGLDAISASALNSGHSGLAALGLLIPPLGFIVWVLAMRRRVRLKSDVAFRRSRMALKEAQPFLREATSKLKAGDDHDAAMALSRALRTYMGNRLNVEGTALTPRESAQLLADRGAGPQTVASVEAALLCCETFVYGAPDSRTRVELTEHVRRAVSLLKGMAAELR